MCYNKLTYYNCIEKHLRSSEAQLCTAPYKCRCWRRHDPDRLKRLHFQETIALELCPKCPARFGGCRAESGNDDEKSGPVSSPDDAALVDERAPRGGAPSEAVVQELRMAKRALLVPKRVASLRKGDSLGISIRMKAV
ncbi:hypothetical protein PG993_008819 [Apiospora rasikravindrae]|uniref:Uncharacterized protein n=1 Tax=Apiospora rasikravindrae TaxID=990691 RepID=A0ABR1SPF5_9PEZI